MLMLYMLQAHLRTNTLIQPKHAFLCKSVNSTSNGSICPAQQLLHLILQPLNLTSSVASWQWFC